MDRNPASGWRLTACLVALRKESVDRNCYLDNIEITQAVALRKESVDRNDLSPLMYPLKYGVALRKESVDRNFACPFCEY